MTDDVVLVVEDEDQAREFLTEILAFEGFKALGFANGAEALAYMETAPTKPCLIVLDILMPVMNGRQLRAEMLKNKELAEIPVIVITALDPSEVRDLKAIRVIAKPINVDLLISAVRAAC
jgi:DNA-binding response OmpR family regulator